MEGGINLKLGDPSSAQDSIPPGYLILGKSCPLHLGFCLPNCQKGHCFRSVTLEVG